MRGRVAPFLLGGGIVLGAGWRMLQQWVPGRLDVALGFGLLFIVLAILANRGLLHVPDCDRALLGIPAVLLMVALIWRDSGALYLLNLLALAGLVAFSRPVRVGLRARVLDSDISDLVRRSVHALRGAACGAWQLLRGLRGPEAIGASRSRWAAGLGVVAASPVLALFSLLLGSADPVFGHLLERLFNPQQAIETVVPLLLWCWLGAGLLWALTRPPSAIELPPAGGKVSSAFIVGALAPIAMLFLTFLVVQSRYLFGGRAVVLGTAELSFSEYARRGFFELVTVSAAMLPVLLVSDWAADQRSEQDRRRFRFLARLLLVLLTGLLGSALLRMAIYTGEYGLTEQRLFTTVFMGWLAFVFAWFSASVLHSRRDRFTAGALGAALAALLLLNVAGPEQVIVRVNAWRAERGRPFDARYLASLGAGAVPAALDVLRRLPDGARCEAARHLDERWSAAGGGVQPRWTIERWRATGPLLAHLQHEVDTACNLRGNT